MPRRKQIYPQRMNAPELGPKQLKNRPEENQIFKDQNSTKDNRQRHGSNGSDSLDTDTVNSKSSNQTLDTKTTETMDYDPWSKSHKPTMEDYNYCDEPIDLSMKSTRKSLDAKSSVHMKTEPEPSEPSSLQALEMKFGKNHDEFLSETSSLLQLCSKTSYFLSLPEMQSHGLYSRQPNFFPPNKAANETSEPTSSTHAGLNKHELLEHARAKLHAETTNHTKFVCICHKTYESLYEMSIHLKETGHVPSKENAKLAEYPKLVRGQDMWLTHGSAQTKEILKCICCQESFKSLPDLTVHMMKTKHYTSIMSQRSPLPHTGNSPSKSSTYNDMDERSDEKGVDMISCKVCCGTFTSMEKLALHMSDTGHHKVNLRKVEDKRRMRRRNKDGHFKCTVCRKVYATSGELKKHMNMSGHRFSALKEMYSGERMDKSSDRNEKESVKQKMPENNGNYEKGTSCIECPNCFKQIASGSFPDHAHQCLLKPEQNSLQMLKAKFGKSSSLMQKSSGDKMANILSSPFAPTLTSSPVYSAMTAGYVSPSKFPRLVTSPTKTFQDKNERKPDGTFPLASRYKYLAPSVGSHVETTDIFSAMESMITQKIEEKSKDMVHFKDRQMSGGVWANMAAIADGGDDGKWDVSEENKTVDIKIESTDNDSQYGVLREPIEKHGSSTSPNGVQALKANFSGFCKVRDAAGLRGDGDRRSLKRRHSDSCFHSSSIHSQKHARPFSAPVQLVRPLQLPEKPLATKGLNDTDMSEEDSHNEGTCDDRKVYTEQFGKNLEERYPHIDSKRKNLEEKYLHVDSKNGDAIPVLQSLESLVQRKTHFSSKFTKVTKPVEQNYVDVKENKLDGGKNPLESLKYLISTTNTTIKDTSSMATILGTTNLPNVLIPQKGQLTAPSVVEPSSMFFSHNIKREASSPPTPKVLDLSQELGKKSTIAVPPNNVRLASNFLSSKKSEITKETNDFSNSTCKHCRRIFRTKGGLRYHMTSCMPIQIPSLLEARKSNGVKNVIQKHLEQSQFTRYYKWAEELSSKS